MNKRTMLLAGLLAAGALIGGCASTTHYGTRYSETVYVAPPPPRVEYIGPPPVVGHVWITGYWNWGGSRYVWVPGRWEAPRHGHHWVPHRWERDGQYWRQHGGHWEKTTVIVQPPRPPVIHHPPGHVLPRQEHGKADDRRDDRDRPDWRGGRDQQRGHDGWDRRRDGERAAGPGNHDRQEGYERREQIREEPREQVRIERDKRNERREITRGETPDGHDRSGRHGGMRAQEPGAVPPQGRDAPRQEMPRIAMDAPRGNPAVMPEPRCESRSDAGEPRGERQREGRNSDEPRRERGRERNP